MNSESRCEDINVEACSSHGNESDSDKNLDQFYISLDVESDADVLSCDEESSSYELDKKLYVVNQSMTVKQEGMLFACLKRTNLYFTPMQRFLS